MSQEKPDDVPECYTPEEMDRLIQRLSKAGWLDGNQFVDGNEFSVHYSKKGSDGMKSLVKLFESHAPGYLDAAPKKPAQFGLDFILTIWLSAPDLILPFQGLSLGEGNAFVGLIVLYHRKYRPQPPENLPPSRF